MLEQNTRRELVLIGLTVLRLAVPILGIWLLGVVLKRVIEGSTS